MSLTLAPPSLPASSIAPPLASLRRLPSAGAASSSSARPPSSRLLRVSCLSACHALPPPPPPSIADLGPSPRRGERLSLYEVLRVGEDASAREIKAAYRALAKAYHPDTAREAAGPDGRDFMEIHDAYETLSDPAARAVYDLSLGRRRRRAGRGGFCTTRRWETDQCW